MAALVEGQQYGLSAQDKINCNKSLVFVKLTDSALRSIEEYVKYKGDTLSKPTIEFQNNNGIITLPLNGCNQTYGFTVSNVEADGPKGSFECLRQNGHRSLESLGCMHMKMHIHAKEDSYEKTRVKMAAAEQEHKKFCTKEIKPNAPHLGRKVKVKRPGLVVSPVKISSPPTSTLSSKPTFKPLSVPPVKKIQEQPKFPKVNALKNKFASPELLRKPIRDRIIHCLAIKPYKRPELIVRLMSEGLREKDKNGITAILTQVSTLKGNVYILANYLWNEVQENWKYCTQEELEIIQKKKQQFLNSNNETEVITPNPQPSSPVQKRVALPEPVTTGQEPRSKKQRISHYSRPDQGCKDNADQVMKNDSSEYSASDKIQPPTLANSRKSPNSCVQVIGNRSGQDDSSQKSPVGINYDSYSNSNSSQKNSTPSGGDDLLSSSLNQRSSTREDSEKNIRNHTSGLSQVSASYTNHDKSSHKGTVISKNSRLETDDSNRRHLSNKYQKTSSDSVDESEIQPLSHPLSVDSVCDPKPHVSPDSNTHCQSKESRRDDCSKTVTNGYVNNSIKNGYNNQPSFLNRSKVTSTTNGSCSNSPHSSSDSRDSMEYNSSDLVPHLEDSPSDFDCPEYVKEYGRILSSEQRAQYKADFSAQYEEYLHLHSKINLISRRFASLEHNLHTCEEGSEEFKRIKGKIYKEYRAYQQDSNYVDALKKFNFLHCKLSHIKRLVMEYDSAQHVKS